MFWKRKHETVAAAVEGKPATQTAEKKGEAPSQVRAEGPRPVKLPGPRNLPGLVEKYIVANYKIEENMVRLFRIVERRRPGTERANDCRIYDPEDAEANEVQVKDYTSLDKHADLILYEGWFDDESKRVELTEKKKVSFDIPPLTEAQILQKIEALTEPGSSVFFYQNAGSSAGGPLGRGAAIIELNPDYGKTKAKKYIIYTANVVNMQPTAKRNRLFDSNKAKDIAKWTAQSYKKRVF